MIISYQLKVFHGQSEVTFGEFEHKKLIFSLKLEFYQKRSQPPILVTEIQSYKTETKKNVKKCFGIYFAWSHYISIFDICHDP